jgi:hypothetical protein
MVHRLVNLAQQSFSTKVLQFIRIFIQVELPFATSSLVSLLLKSKDLLIQIDKGACNGISTYYEISTLTSILIYQNNTVEG